MKQIIEYLNEFLAENSMILLETLLILVLGVLIIRIVLTLLKRILKKQNRIDPIIIPFIRSITKVILYIILFITIASKLGFSTTSLATILGALGLALSLSIQNSLGNIVNGIFLMLSKPFVRGSTVSINGVDGIVESIGLIYTKLTTADRQVLIPNSDVANAKISQLSAVSMRRFDVKLVLSYQNDVDYLREVSLDVVSNDNGLSLKEPEPTLTVTNLLPQGIEITLRAWIIPENYLKFQEYIYEALKKRFDEEGILIPGATTEVLLKKEG